MLIAYHIGLSFRNACKECALRKQNGNLHVLNKFDKKGCYKRVDDKLFAVLEAMAVEWYCYDSLIKESLKKLDRGLRRRVTDQ